MPFEVDRGQNVRVVKWGRNIIRIINGVSFHTLDTSVPTDLFSILEPQNPSIDVYELLKAGRSPFFWLKIEKGWIRVRK